MVISGLNLSTLRSLVITIPRSYRVSTENGWKSVLLGNLNRFNRNRLRLKRLILIEHDLNLTFLLLSFKALLGENRQRYLERLKERLERRQKRLEEGLDPDEEDEETMRLLNEEQTASTGNILQDLQNRYDEEKDALLRRLQEEQDRMAAEKRRQAELVRLRREKRQAEREANFDEAALVLGLAERNRQNLEER